ncbi:MAG TPA: hypothetical protein DC017_16630 [Candidatus Wallbacteria bacterium]|nr:hypothetical protein [Candidatus Wallbacteria bacterium]
MLAHGKHFCKSAFSLTDVKYKSRQERSYWQKIGGRQDRGSALRPAEKSAQRIISADATNHRSAAAMI